jgi:hypothetical protein
MYRPGPIELDRWYEILIRIRGTEAACFIDGDLVFDEDDPRFPAGQVGFSTWEGVAHFRNIKVTSPGGGVLWEGLPRPPVEMVQRAVPAISRPGIRKNHREEFDHLAQVQLEMLRRDMEKSALAPAEQRPGPPSDALQPGTVWKGERTYRHGGYAGKTVTYELHVRERAGTEFKGHKFDNGPRRNRVEVRGFIDGETISWIEQAPTSLMTVKGTIKKDIIDLTFDGIYADGAVNVGDGKLTRE